MTALPTPVRDKVVVEVADRETSTSSGIVLPEMETTLPLRGTVVSVGSGRIDHGVQCDMDVQEGDEVYFVQGGSLDLDRGGKHIILAEDNIVARVEGDAVVPYWDKALIELVKNDEVTAGGLILSATRNEKGYDEGVVLAVGPGYIKKGLRIPMSLNAGDRVLFNQYMSAEIDLGIDDERLLFLAREFDVYGVLS